MYIKAEEKKIYIIFYHLKSTFNLHFEKVSWHFTTLHFTAKKEMPVNSSTFDKKTFFF